VIQRILLVGASGPLGRAVSAVLSGDGHEVRGVSRTGGGRLAQLDVADTSQVLAAVQSIRPHSVVYLARPELTDTHSVDLALEDFSRFIAVCAAEGVSRVIFASSAAIYGTSTSSPHREDEPVEANGLYAQLKLRSESLLTEVANVTAMSALSFRIFNVFGPGFTFSLINRLVLGDDPTPVLHVGQDFVRDYIHSADVARAFAMALVDDVLAPPLLNLATGIPVSNDDLLSQIPGARFIASEAETFPSHSVADVALLSATLGFQPTITVAMAAGSPATYFR